jgi:hypothetical protein
MTHQNLVHEIQLGAVKATIWEDVLFDGPKYRVSICRALRDGEPNCRPDCFEPEDLPVVAEVVDLAHLWICEQAELIA